MSALLSALVPLLGGAGATAYSVVHWRRARAFEDTPASRVRSAAQGYVELSGIARALPGTPTRAPLTGKPCLWFQYKIEERGSRNDWRTIDSGTSDETFALDDDTGRVTVDPTGADVTALDKSVWYADDPGTLPALRPIQWMGALASRYRCTERLIVEGQPLSAVGLFRTQRAADAAGSPDTELALRLREWKQDPQRMARVDRDHDGTISPAEWEQARSEARDEVLKELREQAAQPGWHVLQKPVDGRPFLLGAGSVASLAGRYRRYAWLLLAAGIALWGIGIHGLAA